MQMAFTEGESRNYSESVFDNELIFQNGNEVTAIPARLLKPGAEFNLPSLPFAVRVKQFWKNSDLAKGARGG